MQREKESKASTFTFRHNIGRCPRACWVMLVAIKDNICLLKPCVVHHTTQHKNTCQIPCIRESSGQHRD